MMNLYRAVSDRLDAIDFNAIWAGFRRTAFALYDGAHVATAGEVFPVDDRFLGNTSIELGGVQTAIWKLDGCPDADVLTSGIVHEMFHSHQMLSGDARFPDDLELFRLGVDPGELSLRALECAVLAVPCPSLGEFADVRRRRRAANPALAHQAERAETIEGMAEYAGLRALSMLSPEAYAAACSGHRARLSQPEAVIDARRIAYSAGALLLLAAQEHGIDASHPLGAEHRTLAEIMLAQLSPIPAGIAPDLRALARETVAARKAECRAFLARATRTPRRAQITGYDPMNMVRAGDLILCRRFVMLDGALIRGPLLLEMQPDSRDQTAALYLAKRTRS
ncbi:MAG: hypothetical protein ACOYI5_06525 [Christensenellales bacterium]